MSKPSDADIARLKTIKALTISTELKELIDVLLRILPKAETSKKQMGFRPDTGDGA